MGIVKIFTVETDVNNFAKVKLGTCIMRYTSRMKQKSISELMDLSGKVAVVTGGAIGIGYAISARLAEAGARVFIADKDAAAAEAAAAKLPNAVACAVDVADETQVGAMVAQAVQAFGSVDILVNNAGIYPQVPVMNASLADFEKILKVNLEGAFLCAHTAAKQMIAQEKGGSIIFVTSIDALHPSSVGLAFYDASKHGLWGFAKNLALELAPHHIRVNAIAPGGVATPGTNFGKPVTPDAQKITDAFLAKIPMHRMANADEIGTVALFLASGLSSYMTGSQIVVDGGALLA